jgi:transposase-like protein
VETKKTPVAGIDYPRNLIEFDSFFSSEKECRDYLMRVRWSEGFICPRCGVLGEPWRLAKGVLKCRACRRKTTVTAGTAFEDIRKPLRTWFQALWFVTSQKHGVSALGLQRVLGFGSYQTAWSWLHKLRRVMVRPDRDLLSGEVEVDEIFVGGHGFGAASRKKLGRGSEKTLVAVAVETTGGRFGRIRLRRVRQSTRRELHAFVQENVAKGATVSTDGWQAYYGLESLGYTHQATVFHGRPNKADAHILMPYVHRVAGLLKRWWLGIHHGAIEPQHIDYYLDEFTFRFNRRTSRSRGLLFFRLVQQAASGGHVPYHALVGGKTAPPPLAPTTHSLPWKDATRRPKRQRPPSKIDRPTG